MPIVRIDCERIRDWDSFHDLFAETFGFPKYYGRNMDAWNDCMIDIDGMTSVDASVSDPLVLVLDNVKTLHRRCRKIYDAIVDCAAFVNHACIEEDEPPILILAFHLDA